MAEFTLNNVKIQIKHDTSSNWEKASLVPLVGEMCLATDTGEVKFGDGTNTWSNLDSIGKISKPTSTNGILSVNGTNITIYELPIATNSTLGGIKSGSEILVNSSTGVASLATSGVTANDEESDDLYFAFKTDDKGRVVDGLTEDDVIASDKNTDETDAENQYSSTLGLVKSDFDEFLDANDDDNKGKVAIDEYGNMTVIRVDESDKLHTARTIAFAAQAADNTDPENPIPAIPTDATGTLTFDGSQNVTTQLTLVDTAEASNFDSTDTTNGYRRVVVSRVDTKGRIVGEENLLSAYITDAISTATNTGDDVADRTADAERLVKTCASGQYKGMIDPNLVMDGQSLLESNKIQAELLTNTLTGISSIYILATGTYVANMTYYTDATGKTEVDTTDFVEGVTDVSSYYIESQSTTNTEVDMSSKIETKDGNNEVTNVEYSANYVLNAVNI